jgi:hypothetical protein
LKLSSPRCAANNKKATDLEVRLRSERDKSNKEERRLRSERDKALGPKTARIRNFKSLSKKKSSRL